MGRELDLLETMTDHLEEMVDIMNAVKALMDKEAFFHNEQLKILQHVQDILTEMELNG